MNYLAIDTSGAHLTVVARKGDKKGGVYDADAGLRHSVRLMDGVERALREADMRPEEADFFAAVVGPGSFTGIRIGVSAAKALAYAFGKPVKSVTSFDTAAYHVGNERTLALADARHGCYYACVYEGGEPAGEPAFLPLAEVEKLAKDCRAVGIGGVSGIPAERADLAAGLARAAEEKPLLPSEELLVPLYIRKSQAEEGR